MAIIEESAVFEHCQKVFRELEERDGRYYPSRHDKDVYEQTADFFSISENEVDRIFSEYSKRAANIEMENIKKLSPELQKELIKQQLIDIIGRNGDLS